MDQPPIIELLDALAHVAVPLVPRDIVRKHLAGIKTHTPAAESPRPRLGGGEQALAHAGASHCRCRRHAPQKKVVGSQLQNEHAREAVGSFREPYFVLRKNLRIVGEQRQWLDAEERPISSISSLL